MRSFARTTPKRCPREKNRWGPYLLNRVIDAFVKKSCFSSLLAYDLGTIRLSSIFVFLLLLLFVAVALAIITISITISLAAS